MATEVKIRRGTAAQNAAFTGAAGEITYSTDERRLITHDGATLGGEHVAKLSELTAGLALKENVANKSTDGTMAANSPILYPSQSAVVTFVATAGGAFVLKAGDTMTGTLNITPAVNTSALTVSGYSLTGADTTSMLSLSGTWNTTGQPTAIKLNVTKTAANSGMLLQMQESASNRYRFFSSGQLTFNPEVGASSIHVEDSVTGTTSLTSIKVSSTWNTTGTNVALLFNLVDTASSVNSAFIECTTGGFPTTVFRLRKDGTFFSSGQSLTGSAATSIADLSGTWNTTGAPIAIKLNITNTASDTTSLLMDLQKASISRFKIGVDGFGYFHRQEADNNSSGIVISKRGTIGDSTAAVVSGVVLSLIQSSGWDGAAQGTAGDIRVTALETFTGSAHGGQFLFRLTPTGSTTTATVGTWTSTGLTITGRLTLSAALSTAVVAMTDAATLATDAALGNHFRVTLGGNRTLGNPTNAYDGARIVYEFIQDGTGSRTITLDTNFALGTDISAVTLTTTVNKRDFMTVFYNSTAVKWYVVSFIKGY